MTGKIGEGKGMQKKRREGKRRDGKGTQRHKRRKGKEWTLTLIPRLSPCDLVPLRGSVVVHVLVLLLAALADVLATGGHHLLIDSGLPMVFDTFDVCNMCSAPGLT